MEPINDKSRKANSELSVADLLCSAGFLPPRNERDVERFERIYKGRTFKTEAYIVNANAIFDKVTGEDRTTTRTFRPVATIFDRPGALRVAESTTSSFDESAAKALSQLIENKKD